MTNLNANGAQSEMKSRNSTAQNEVFDSEQIHSEQLELPDGSEYLDESKSKIKTDLLTNRDQLHAATCVVPLFLCAIFTGINDRMGLSEMGIRPLHYLMFFGLISFYYFVKAIMGRIPNEYFVLDKVDKSIDLYEKVDEKTDKFKSVHLSFEDMRFIAIDEGRTNPKPEHEWDYVPKDVRMPCYRVSAISNDSRLFHLTHWDRDFQRIDRYANYLADLTNSELLEFPGDGTQLYMIGNQIVRMKPITFSAITMGLIVVFFVCFYSLAINFDRIF